ncbi:MAG: M67 family metallopeptidase [Chloroflexi bacterium]|nr:M67 family metallopeptidase [Chloroflexota bacterium]
MDAALSPFPQPTHGLILRREHVAAMREDVAAAAPLEACGLVAVQRGVSQRVYPIPNMAASPVRYRLEPHAYLRALQDMEAHGWTLGLIYHSHPHGGPTPSAVDLAEATYPDAVYYIWAPVGAVWVGRGYYLTPQAARPVPVRWE